MRKMIKMIGMVCALAMTLTMVGCKSGEAVPEIFNSGDINAINITTGANDVIIRHTEDDVFTVSMKGHEGGLAVLDGDTLTMDVPMPGAGINLKSPEPLYIDVPKNSCQSITVNSESGSVRIENIEVSELNVSTQYGNITTVGLTGSINAKSESGEIECDLSGSGITAGENGIGASLKGFIGESEDAEHTLILYTNVGKVTLTK